MTKKIKQLSENTNPDGTDGIEIDDGTNSEYVKINNLFNGAPTTGDLIYHNGTKWVRLTAGALGYVLSSGGAGVAPAWAVGDLIGERRLSLTSATPVTSADVTAATTVYWTDGTTNLSVAVPSTTVTPFDVFYDTSAGTLSTVNWTNDTTRATALVRSGGRLAKTADTAKIYLGTGRTTGSSGQCEDSAAKRFLWNHYNRKARPVNKQETTSSWTYGTATVRQANGSSANQVEIVIGVAEDDFIINVLTSLTGTGYGFAGIAEDSTTAFTTSGYYQGGGGASGSEWFVFSAALNKIPAIGYHYYAWVETTNGVNVTFYGGTGANAYRAGLFGTVWG